MKKILSATAMAAALVATSAGAAAASHDHYVSREDRNGQTHCRYIAEGQTSKEADEGGGHQFHDHVHNGQPGDDERGTDFNKSDNVAECDTVTQSGQGPRP